MCFSPYCEMSARAGAVLESEPGLTGPIRGGNRRLGYFGSWYRGSRGAGPEIGTNGTGTIRIALPARTARDSKPFRIRLGRVAF